MRTCLLALLLAFASLANAASQRYKPHVDWGELYLGYQAGDKKYKYKEGSANATIYPNDYKDSVSGTLFGLRYLGISNIDSPLNLAGFDISYYYAKEKATASNNGIDRDVTGYSGYFLVGIANIKKPLKLWVAYAPIDTYEYKDSTGKNTTKGTAFKLGVGWRITPKLLSINAEYIWHFTDTLTDASGVETKTTDLYSDSSYNQYLISVSAHF